MDVLDRHLEAVERPRLRDLHLVHEAGPQVLEHDAVRGREEGQHVGDEVALVGRELVPVGEVVGEVDLLGLCFVWVWIWRFELKEILKELGEEEEVRTESERGERRE